jgi:hypothetical protein
LRGLQIRQALLEFTVQVVVGAVVGGDPNSMGFEKTAQIVNSAKIVESRPEWRYGFSPSLDEEPFASQARYCLAHWSATHRELCRDFLLVELSAL